MKKNKQWAKWAERGKWSQIQNEIMRKNKQWAKWAERAKWSQIQNEIMRKNKQWAKWAEFFSGQKGQSGHKFKMKS